MSLFFVYTRVFHTRAETNPYEPQVEPVKAQNSTTRDLRQRISGAWIQLNSDRPLSSHSIICHVFINLIC